MLNGLVLGGLLANRRIQRAFICMQTALAIRMATQGVRYVFAGDARHVDGAGFPAALDQRHDRALLRTARLTSLSRLADTATGQKAGEFPSYRDRSRPPPRRCLPRR